MLAASYEAKALGVRTAMGGAPGAAAVPDAIVVPPRMSAYSEASKAVFEVFDDTTPLVEGLSIDEAFLDVGGLSGSPGTPVEIAARLRRDVLERVGLPITVGVARTKFLAKVASGVAKPDGLLVVAARRRARVPASAAGRAAVGRRPGDRAEAPRPRDRDGRRGRAARARPRSSRCSAGRSGGTCTRSPTTATRGRCTSAAAGARSARSARWAARRGRRPSSTPSLVGLVDRVTRRMRAAGRVGRTVVLRLRFDDFSRATRSHTLPHADRADRRRSSSRRAGCSRPRMPMIEQRGLTLVGVAVDEPRRRRRASSSRCRSTATAASALDAALDEVRRRFGSKAVTRAVLLGRDPGLTVPLLPD